jgi:hypothetical protein
VTTTGIIANPATRPVITLEQIKARWPEGFAPFATDAYQPFAELGFCRRCGKNGLTAKAFERTEPHGPKVRIVLVCPKCDHAREV